MDIAKQKFVGQLQPGVLMAVVEFERALIKPVRLGHRVRKNDREIHAHPVSEADAKQGASQEIDLRSPRHRPFQANKGARLSCTRRLNLS